MSFEIGGVALPPVYPVSPISGQSGAGDSTESSTNEGSSDGGPDAVYEPSQPEGNEPLTYSNPYASAPSAPPADEGISGSGEGEGEVAAQDMGEGSEPLMGESAETGSDGHQVIEPESNNYSDYGNDVSPGDYVGEDSGTVEQSYAPGDPSYEPGPASVESDSYGDPGIEQSDGYADPNMVVDAPFYGPGETMPDEGTSFDPDAAAQDGAGDGSISPDPAEDPYAAQAYGEGNMGVDAGGDVNPVADSGDEIPSDIAEEEMAASGETAQDETTDDATVNSANIDGPAPSPNVASRTLDAASIAYAPPAQRAASQNKQPAVTDKAGPSLAMALGHRPAAMSLALQIGQVVTLPSPEKTMAKTDIAATPESTSVATPPYPARFARVSRATTKASPLLGGASPDAAAQSAEAPKARANVMASAAYALVGDAHRAERSVLNLLKFG